MQNCKQCSKPIIDRRKQAVFCSKKCNNAHNKPKSPSRDPKARREWALKDKYGLSWEDYVRLHTESKGSCCICNTPLSLIKCEDKETAYVDHCHTTGKIRGLLCNSCNRGLGQFRDNEELLLKALLYLKAHAN